MPEPRAQRLAMPNGKLYQALPNPDLFDVGTYYLPVRLDLCSCGGSICEDDQSVYLCKGCKRFVPWCYGAADSMPEYCDDCWAKARKEAPMSPYTCPECSSDRISHVQSATTWSSQCLKCGHVWGTSAYTRAPAEARTVVHPDDEGKPATSDTVEFGPFHVSRVSYESQHDPYGYHYPQTFARIELAAPGREPFEVQSIGPLPDFAFHIERPFYLVARDE